MGQHHLHIPQAEEGGGDLTAADPTPSDPDADEAARRLFAASWEFLRPSHAMTDLPPASAAEVAFAGRSNVGKSSLINALVGQKKLAHASNTPGRTRALNFFARPDRVGPILVDMPGYGYAKAPKEEVAAWTRLVFDFLRGRPVLRRVYLLVDARHGPKPVDLEAMGVLDDAAVSYQAVLTKADKIGPRECEAVVAATLTALRRRPAAHPAVILTSAETGAGIADLRAAIVAAVAD